MRIMIFNWRDIKNPFFGGAEILTHEIAKRWVKWGHQVTQFSASYPGGKSEEVVDGVKIIRQGSVNIRSFHIPVHLAAFWWYRKYGQGKFDLIIDEIHGIPFFTPFYVKEKKVALICEVAKEIWDQMFSFPWNAIGRVVEKFYFRIYQKVPFLTISFSTKKDLINCGIKKDKIKVLPMGVNLKTISPEVRKEKVPTLIFVGRLCQMKGIEDGIKAFKLVQKKIPQAQFWIVGTGEKSYVSQLKKCIEKMKLATNVSFFDFVSEKKKFILMKRAHVLIHPSVREGWGLVVIEANSMETPAVVYSVPGLCDSTKDGVTGLVCQDNQPRELAKNVLKLIKDKKLYQRLQKQSLEWSQQFSWEKTAQESLELFKCLHSR